MAKAKAKPKKSGPTPKNKALYSRVKSEAKRKFDVWQLMRRVESNNLGD